MDALNFANRENKNPKKIADRTLPLSIRDVQKMAWKVAFLQRERSLATGRRLTATVHTMLQLYTAGREANFLVNDTSAASALCCSSLGPTFN